MKAQRSRGTGWVTTQHLLFAVQLVSVACHRSHRRAPGAQAAGAALLFVAAAYGLPGIRALGRNRTALPEPKSGGELVTTGIYARVRHPLYASMITGGFGWALVWGSWPALILAAVQAVFLRAKAINEEQRLRERFFGYGVYARRVPRFIPRFLSTQN